MWRFPSAPDLAAQPAGAVDQLAVEQLEPGVQHPSGHQLPPLVMIISGMVAAETTTSTTR
jgi:hypothetical protein